MKLKASVYRKAANHVYTLNFMSKNFFNLSDYDSTKEFSCNAVGAFGGEYYEYAYRSVFRSQEAVAVITVRSIIENQKANFQTQLHRALMLDLMAEMIEQGDL